MLEIETSRSSHKHTLYRDTEIISNESSKTLESKKYEQGDSMFLITCLIELLDSLNYVHMWLWKNEKQVLEIKAKIIM